MALRKTLTFGALTLGLTLAFGAHAFAQQQPQSGDSNPQQRERGGRRRGGPRGEEFGMMRGLRELNLTEAQQQQVRAVFERFNTNIKPQREQLMALREQFEAGNAPADAQERAKALRAQIHESAKAMNAEIQGILTQEQRAKLEQIKQERKSRRDQMRQRREGAQPEIQ
ncbi:MAG TPA: Spy/CpxP family protein refolding chaperone [Pyrinomonadaceae bacterium]|jgi:Spy/CpxP family protein refolding chaperone